MVTRKNLLKMPLLLSAFCLSACGMNLGVFEKEDGYESYYAAFGDVKGLYDGGDHEYDINDSLFNSKTIEEFSWDDGDEVEKEEYVYLILPFKEKLCIEDIAIYFYADIDANIEISVFYFQSESSAPQDIRYLTSPDPEPEYDEEGNIIDEGPYVYDDPDVETSVLNFPYSLRAEQWCSFVMEGFHQEGYDDKYLHTGEDGLLYLRIENNSGWNKDRLKHFSFSFINLIIRAI